MDLTAGDGLMNDRPARTAALAIAGLLALVLFGDGPVLSGQQPNQADDGYVFVLRLNDEQIEILKKGQALASPIDPKNRGLFSSVRLEYEPTPGAPDPRSGATFNLPGMQNSAPSFNGGNTQSGFSPIATAGNQFLGPPLPQGWQPPRQDFSSSGSLFNGNTVGGSNTGSSGMVPPVPRTQFGNGSPVNTFGNGVSPNQGSSGFPGQGNNPSTNTPSGSGGIFPGAGNPPGVPQSQPGNFQDTRANPAFDPNSYARNQGFGNSPSLLTPNIPSRSGSFQDYDNPQNGVGGTVAGQAGISGSAPASQGSLLDRMQNQVTQSILRYPESYRTDTTYPSTANTWSDYGGRNLLASTRDTLASTRQLPMAAIPGAANDPALSAFRDTATPTAALEDANRKNAFLFFWLLCSIGLNIYLGWISRGFYVRYRELAEELRETFSTV
jgi:hypothetical protein